MKWALEEEVEWEVSDYYPQWHETEYIHRVFLEPRPERPLIEFSNTALAIKERLICNFF